ncbi:MAG: protein kinase [Eggerthellaceae bacterium]|nr:protein kinase [Eggerthellaceae bacterium]
MDDLTGSIDFSVLKEDVFEGMTMVGAAFAGLDGGMQEAITDERIEFGDKVLETYEVVSDAISGGMGSVWRVHHGNWGIDLAMKRPHPRFFAEASAHRKAAFLDECEHWIEMGLHPNIVSCYYVRAVGGVPTVFSEWMDRGSLKDVIANGALYDGEEGDVQERILDIAIQAARGLAFSQERDLLHQDVKPGNLLVTGDWEVKVADFGLAKAVSKLGDEDAEGGADADPWADAFSSALSSLGMYAEARAAFPTGYTLAYCPQEQADGAPAQAWMDVYAWALVVLEMYAGERLWDVGSEAAECFDDIAAKLNWKAPEQVISLLQDCLVERGAITFDEVTRRCEEAYRQMTGKRYPRPDARGVLSSALSLSNYALSFLDLGKEERALELWDEAVKVDSACVPALYNRTLFGYRTGLLDDVAAVAALRTLAYSGDNDPEAFWALARIQLECRDADLPKTLDKIEELFPDADAGELDSMREAAERNFPKQVYHFNNPNSGPVDVSPDGTHLLIHDSDCGRETESVIFCDIEEREEISRMIREPDVEPHAEVRAMLSKDNQFAFGIYAQDPFVYKWRTSDGEQIVAMVMRKIPGEQICAYDVDAAGEWAILGSTSGRVGFLRTEKQETASFTTVQGHFGVCITDDGRKGLVSCREEDRIEICNREDGSLVKISVPSPVFAHFALDDTCVLSISGDASPMIRLHDVVSGECRYEVPFPRLDEFMGRQGQFSMSMDGRRVLLRGNKGYLLFDVAAHRWLITLTENQIGEQTNLTFKAFLPGAGDRVYLTSFLSSLRGIELPSFTEDSPWNLSVIRTAKESFEEEEAFAGFVVWAEDALDSGDVPTALECAAKAATVGEGRFRSDEAYTSLVRSLMSRCAIAAVGTPLLLDRTPVFTAPIAVLSPSPDGALIAAISQDGELAVVDASSGSAVYRDVARRHAHLKKPLWLGTTLYSLVVAGLGDMPDGYVNRPFRISDSSGQTGRMGISYRGVDLGGSACGQIFAFDLGDLAGGEEALAEDPAKPALGAQDVTDYQVMRGGAEFLCRKLDGSVSRIAVEGAEKVLMGPDEEYQITGSALSRNERVAVLSVGDIMNFQKAETCSSKAVFFDATSGKILFKTVDASITSACAFTDDGRYAIVGNDVFDFHGGAQGSIPIDGDVHVAFLENRYAVGLEANGALSVCELSSRQQVLSAEVGDGPTAIACSPDGAMLYVGNSQGQLATWLWDHELEVAQVFD